MNLAISFLLLLIFTLPSFGEESACMSQAEDDLLRQIVEFNETYTHSKAINLSDSLLFILEKEGRESCGLFYKIKIEKGKAHRRLTQYEEALQEFYAVVTKAEEDGEFFYAAKAYCFIALVHEVLGRMEDCKYNLDQARHLIKDHDLEAVYPWFCVRASSYHRFYGSLDSAQYFATQALKFAVFVGDERSEMDGALLGGILAEDLDTALMYFERVIDIFLKNNNYLGASQQALNITQVNLRNGRYQNARLCFDRVEAYMSKVSEKNREYFVNKSLLHEYKMNYYGAIGAHDSVLIAGNKAIQFNKKAGYEIDQRLIDKSESRFAIEREQQRILQLEKDSRTQKNTIIVGAILLILLSALFYFLFQNRVKITEQNELILRQNESLLRSNEKNELLLSEVHHRIKNNLQNIISLIILKQNASDDPKEKESLDDISNRVQAISLIHEQLYSTGEFDKIEVGHYFEKLVNHFSRLLGQVTEFEVDFDIGDIRLNLETVIPLGVIFSELLTNAIKYANATGVLIIKVGIYQNKDHSFTFTIVDNGKGFSQKNENKQGLGLRLISNMVRQLQGQMERSTSSGALTKITFREKQISSI